MTIFGIDCSHYDWDRGTMDVAAMRRDGMQFATHKVSEGTSYADPRFTTFAARARTAGMPLIGGYCVNRPGDQKPQVDWFIKQLDGKAPWWRDSDFLVQLDCERWSYSAEPSLSEIRAWCDYFMTRTGARWRPIVYAPRWVYGDRLKGLGYPLWASAYGSNLAVPYRTAYPGDGSTRWDAYSGQTPAILQFGSRTIIGSQNTCDANAFRGSLEQLTALTRGDIVISNEDVDKIATAVKSKLLYSHLEQANPQGPSLGTIVFQILGKTTATAEQIAEVDAALAALAGVVGKPVTDDQLAQLAEMVKARIPLPLTVEETRQLIRDELDGTRLGPI